MSAHMQRYAVLLTRFLDAPLCAAGAFPFWRRGDERANSIVRLQQIFPRILAAEYDPPDASPPCLHLLRSLLCSDPSRRADINGIMNHPWCDVKPNPGPRREPHFRPD